MVSGQWSVVSGQWSVVSGQWSVVSDKRMAEGSGISFVTDVEGNLDYMHLCVEHSRWVYYTNDQKDTLELREGGSLVFGVNYAHQQGLHVF